MYVCVQTDYFTAILSGRLELFSYIRPAVEVFVLGLVEENLIGNLPFLTGVATRHHQFAIT